MAPSSALQKFPSISHPLSRLGSREALSITGKSRDGAASVDWSLGSPSPQPPVRSHSVAGSNPSFIRDENGPSRCSTSHDSRRISTEEVLVVLEERLRSGNFHAVKKLFRSNDPNGEGNVTKEAFSRILWNLCGYLSPRKISHVLRRMGLDKNNVITFEDLVTYFRRPSTHGGARESIVKSSFLQKPPNSAPERYNLLTPKSGSVITGQYVSPEVTAEHSWKAFKAMANTGKLNFEDLFPPMCFGDGAYIIPGQMRECLQKLQIQSSDDIVARILRKLDGGSPYAIRTSKLLQHLGLNSEGKLISKTPVEKTATNLDAKTKNSSPDIAPASAPETPQSTSRRPKTSFQCRETLRPQTSSIVPLPTARPKTSMDIPAKVFDGDIMDFIARKLDEGQLQFTRAVESKSTNSNGLIGKADLRNVLKGFGFIVNATTLEHFLAKNGLRKNDGLVSYRLLIRRLQTRSGRGTLFKVMKNQDHLFHDPPPTPSEGMSAAFLETKLLDIFHREFLMLLNNFRQLDPSETGLLTEEEFRAAIETRFGISITPRSWEQFVCSGHLRYVQPPNTATQGEKGYIPYSDFLAKFDVMLRPSTVDAEDPWIEDGVDVDRLKEHKDRYLKSMGADPADHTHRHEPRPLDQLEATLLDVFLYKFQNFKKEYDMIVREDFCRVDKEKFDYILYRCGFVLTPSELSRLWLSMPITRPMESLSLPTILQQVMRIYYATSMPGKFSKSSRDSALVSHVLEKTRVPIVSHWNLLKKKLRYLDPMGTSRIEKTELLDILRGLHLDVTDLELFYLVEMLESRIPGKSNYYRLMEYYVKNNKAKRSQAQDQRPLLSTDSKRAYPKVYGGRGLPKQHDYRYPTPKTPEFITLKNAPQTPPFKRVNVQPGVAKFNRKKSEALNSTEFKKTSSRNQKDFTKYRGNFEFLTRHPTSSNGSCGTKDSLVQVKVKPQIGARELPFMGREMRNEDKRDCGRISVEAFLKILSNYGVSFRDPNEIYKLMSRYDRKLRDEISYEKFLKALA